jgi:hypothetical protein
MTNPVPGELTTAAFTVCPFQCWLIDCGGPCLAQKGETYGAAADSDASSAAVSK